MFNQVCMVPLTHIFYVIQYLPYEYTLKNNTTIDGQVISAGELVLKSQYIWSMKENTNWCWKQQPLEQTIIVPTRTILHPHPDVITIRYLQDIPKNICDRTQAKNIRKDILLLWMMLIMIIFRMKLSVVKNIFWKESEC